ncbi:DUF4873 domain-containing protein [Rhodococcus sp. (in: high G+C Gram-positive bacteria)]|uniref:DUF4873 domain-containing protein n=1 Tax=Rhodococcus sp. TaxID=1831 RepID=UPI0019D83C1B|nr:DUF4873 domain-containing protein [Rhodococcus sp. (in: high G+C Gram-positive bacteria)]MBF0661001.1 DUF4873 domain-containing protein [Rhodococcus sp. (in: high G+C Gram-positive bacteria)]
MSEPDTHHDDAAGYRGPADVVVADERATIDVQLSGRFDPLLGRHVWRGRLRRLAESLPPGTELRPGTEVTITVPGSDGPAVARITETDLWGSHMVDGISRPPYGDHPA